jgi:radical SAM superfamily enzyme YgiQ (UPF0313 family)
MKRKIRFIEPGSRPGRPFNAWIRRWPLLGPIILATILDEKGYDVAVYNENISGPLDENGAAYRDMCSADVIGISIMTATANRGYELARKLRADGPRATLAMGGAHATFMPEEASEFADVVVCGEAENVIEQIASGAIRSGIHRPEPPQDLDRLPPIRHELMVDFDKLIKAGRRRALYQLPMMTSRGCPHNCTYCSVTRMFGRKVRRQSPAKVEEDLRLQMRRGFRHVFFYDDNLTADRTWAKDLLQRMAPMKLRWNAQARADLHWMDSRRRNCDTELLEVMQRSGGDVLYVGYETIDDTTARQWHTGYQGDDTLLERLREDTAILHKHGFWIHAMFMVGPEHGLDNIYGIPRFASRAGIETMQISVLTPLPGTPLFEQMRPELLLSDFPKDWDFYDGTHCVYRHRRLEIPELQQAVLTAHKRFYRAVRPGLRRLGKLVAGPGGLWDKARLICQHAAMTPSIFTQWQRETARYLEMIRLKTQYLTRQPEGQGR